MDSKTIGHKLRALRGEMDAKTVADALGISTSARVSKKFFSQSEYILCSFPRR